MRPLWRAVRYEICTGHPRHSPGTTAQRRKGFTARGLYRRLISGELLLSGVREPIGLMKNYKLEASRWRKANVCGKKGPARW